MMRAHAKRHSVCAGMTLPELMVGLAVGLFVVAIAIATFVSTRTLNVVNSSSTRMTENARLATETLHTDLRAAGLSGCRPLALREDPSFQPGFLQVAVNADAGFITAGYSGIRGYSGTPGATDPLTPHSPALPAAVAAKAVNRLPDSDIISVRVPADTVALGLVSAMATKTSSPQLEAGAAGNAIVTGDVVLISSCKAAALFQVTSANPAVSGVLAHDAGGAWPGNATTDLGLAFGSDATVNRMVTRHYYVAQSVLRPGTNSLWRLQVPAEPGDAQPTPREVASGIDQLRVTYGFDTNTPVDFSVNEYRKAADIGAAAADWDRVLSVRLEMIAATAEDRMSHSNQRYRFDGGVVAAGDRRLRMVLTELVTLRNMSP